MRALPDRNPADYGGRHHGRSQRAGRARLLGGAWPLSLILKRIEGTDKLRKDRERAAEKAKAEKAAEKAKSAGQAERQGGLSTETVAAIREAVEGPRPPARSRRCRWTRGEFPAVPANPGESHLIPDDLSESQSQAIRDSHYDLDRAAGVSHQPHVDPVPRAGEEMRGSSPRMTKEAVERDDRIPGYPEPGPGTAGHDGICGLI